MTFYTNDEELIRLGATYLRIIGFAFLFDSFGQVYACIMVNIGHVLKSTIYSVTSALLNVALNAFLIFGLLGAPKLGIVGAAVASVISVAIKTIFYIIELIKDGFASGLIKRLFFSKSKYLSMFAKQSAPVVMQGFLWALADNVLTSYVGHMGPDVVAGKALIGLVLGMFTAVSMGFREAVNVLIGNDLGRGNLKLAKRKGSWVFRTSIAVGLVNGVLMYMVGRLVMLLPMGFTEDALKYSSIILIIYSLNLLFHSPNNMINGCLFAGGETKYVFMVDAICSWGVLVGIGAILIYVIKAPIIICLFFILLGEWYSFPFKFGRLRSGKWVKNLTKQTMD